MAAETDTGPRHARKRAAPEAAARNRAAAEAARRERAPARRPARPAKPPEPTTFREHRRVAVRQGRQQAVRKLARGTAITPEGAAAYAAGRAGSAARSAGRARVPTGDRQYQGVILAEFASAVLIVALAPIARGKAAQDSTPGPSPYGPDDVKQLAAIGAVYFVLALLSSGNRGRLAAWFGGLVLIAIGLSETTSGGLAGIFGIFKPASQSSGAAEGAPSGGTAGEGGGTPAIQQIPDATGIFPTVEPGGQIVPAPSAT